MGKYKLSSAEVAFDLLDTFQYKVADSDDVSAQFNFKNGVSLVLERRLDEQNTTFSTVSVYDASKYLGTIQHTTFHGYRTKFETDIDKTFLLSVAKYLNSLNILGGEIISNTKWLKKERDDLRKINNARYTVLYINQDLSKRKRRSKGSVKRLDQLTEEEINIKDVI